MYNCDLFILASMLSNIHNLNNYQDLRESDRSPATSPGGDHSGEDLSGEDLAGANYSDADLSGADLSNAVCLFADFSYANLDGANLTSVYLAEANLRGASLKNVQLNVETLESTTMSWWSIVSTLEGAVITDTYMNLADITNAGTYDSIFNSDIKLTISDINNYTNADIVALQATTSARVVDSLSPELLAASTNSTGTAITLKFDENLNVVDISADQFEVSSEREVEVESVSILNDSITLNISSDTPIRDIDNITVSHSGTSVADTSGNFSTLSAQDITNNSTIDSVAPTFTGAETSANGTAVCLRFSEELSSDLAEASAFKVTVDGKASSVASVDITGEDGSSVLLTLTDYIKKGQTVTVSYSDPTFEDDANALQDLIGNDVESLSNKAVTNKSTRGDHSEGDDGDSGNDEKETTPSFRGTKRNDKIKGDNKSNKMYGLKGNDWLYGKLGNDVFNGGKGRDTAQFSSRNNTIKLTTTKKQNTGDGKDRLISIENVNGGGGKDKIIGNKAKNILNGQKGKDRLYGGKNDDILIGGGGKDKCWGQQGRDTFRIKRGAGYMIVKDFSDGKDRIQLGSGHKGLKLKTRGDDVYVYQRKDLMAIVEDAAGDLTRKGKYLV